MQTTLHFKGWSLAGLAGLVFILQLTAPSQAWSMLFIGLGLALATGYFWARALAQGVTLTRERRYTWAQVGDRLEERFTLRNAAPLPALWVEIVDHSTLPGYTASQATGLGAGMTNRWHTDGVCTRRGIFQLGPTELRLGDPLGLFEVRQVYPHRVDFMIVPPILPLPGLRIATRGQFGEQTLRPYSLSRAAATAMVRPYRPGDSRTHIHWPTTARRDSLYVRKREAASAGDWWLVLDLEAGVHSGRGENSTLEKGILIASSLADRGLSARLAVGLMAQGAETLWLPPSDAPIQRWQILRALALASAGDRPLADLLTRNRERIGQQVSLVVITPSTRNDWFRPLLLLARQGVTPTVIFLATERTLDAVQAGRQFLASAGVQTHLLRRSAIAAPTPEHAAGRWTWHVTGTGRAIALRKPQGEWERLTMDD